MPLADSAPAGGFHPWDWDSASWCLHKRRLHCGAGEAAPNRRPFSLRRHPIGHLALYAVGRPRIVHLEHSAASVAVISSHIDYPIVALPYSSRMLPLHESVRCSFHLWPARISWVFLRRDLVGAIAIVQRSVKSLGARRFEWATSNSGYSTIPLTRRQSSDLHVTSRRQLRLPVGPGVVSRRRAKPQKRDEPLCPPTDDGGNNSLCLISQLALRVSFLYQPTASPFFRVHEFLGIGWTSKY